MILQALRADKNISSKLAMKLFDTQIVPILLYGCSSWAIPKTHKLIYLENQPEIGTTRNIVNNFLSSIINRPVSIEYSRRVGRWEAGVNRKILIKFKNYSDKNEILRLASDSDYRVSNEHLIEKVQNDFCKRSLNVSKCATFLYCVPEGN